LYPNPASSVLSIRLSAGSLKTIEVWNVVGQIVNCELVFHNSSENYQLPTAHFFPGIYFIKATDTNGKIMMAKFIKE